MDTNGKYEDPDFCPEQDHFSDEVSAIESTREMAKKAGLTDESIEALFPLPKRVTLVVPLTKAYAESARLASARSRKEKALARMGSTIRSKGHESPEAVRAGRAADTAESNYDKVSREETRKKVVKETGGEKLEALRAAESITHRELAQAKKGGKADQIEAAKAKAAKATKARSDYAAAAKKKLEDDAEKYRKQSDGE